MVTGVFEVFERTSVPWTSSELSKCFSGGSAANTRVHSRWLHSQRRRQVITVETLDEFRYTGMSVSIKVQFRRPISDRSIGTMPIFNAGEFGWNRKSPFSGSTNSGSTAWLWASTPSLCCFSSIALPNAGSAVQ
jgi:hypothetical protein